MTIKRIDFFGQFRPTGVDETAAASMRALAGVAGQARDLAFNVGKEQAIQEGRSAGQQSVQRDEEGKIQAPEMKGNFRFRDKAYNEAAILAHRAEARRDAKETLNRLENEYELDPAAFRQVAAKYKEGVIGAMPDDLKFILNDDIENEIVSRATTLDDKLYQFERQKNLAATVDMAQDLEDSINNAARRGDEQALERYRAERMALMQRGVDNRLIDPVQAAKDAEKVLEGITVNREIGSIERIFSDPSLSMEEKIVRGTEIVDTQKNKVYKDLDPEQRDRLNNVLQAKLNDQLKLEAEMNAQAQKELAYETTQLKLDAKYGRRSSDEILGNAYDMLRNQQITEGEYLGIANDIAADQYKKTQQAMSLSRVSERIKGDESIVVGQKENDLYWDTFIAPQLDGMAPDERVAIGAEYSKAVGGLPSGLNKQITNNLRSGDSELIIEASQTIDAIDNIRGLESPVKPHDRAFAQLVTDLSKSMEPEQALKFAREQSDPENKARIEARERIIKDEKYADEYAEKAIDVFRSTMDFGDVAGIDAMNSAQVEREYKNLFETFFKAGMDEDAARAKTEQLLAKNWTYSESVGRIMKYAPDDFYAVQGDASYIKDQLNEFVRNETSFGITTEGYQNVILVSDEQTGQLAARQQPDYLVYVQDSDGMLNLVSGADPRDGKIKPMRWSPDPKKQHEKLKSMNAEEIMKMRTQATSKRNILNMPAKDYVGPSPARGF